MSRRTHLLLPIILLISLLPGACSNTPATTSVGRQEVTDLYCLNYFVYQMCVRDVDDDGTADLMYFNDTKEIFMLSPEYEHASFAGLTMHRCLQTMNHDIRQASSKLLYIDKNSGAFYKARVKSQLMLAYTHYLPKINHCMNKSNIAGSTDTDDDSFGDEDFDEL